jgi:cytochrome d ubiquinol oxidase subunit II
MVPPTHTIAELAAPRVTQQLVLGVLGVGTVILLPSFAYLYWIFKRRDHGARVERDTAFERLDR